MEGKKETWGVQWGWMWSRSGSAPKAESFSTARSFPLSVINTPIRLVVDFGRGWR